MMLNRDKLAAQHEETLAGRAVPMDGDAFELLHMVLNRDKLAAQHEESKLAAEGTSAAPIRFGGCKNCVYIDADASTAEHGTPAATTLPSGRLEYRVADALVREQRVEIVFNSMDEDRNGLLDRREVAHGVGCC